MTESPQEREQEGEEVGSGPSIQEGGVRGGNDDMEVEDLCDVNLAQGGAGEAGTEQDNDNNSRGDLAGKGAEVGESTGTGAVGGKLHERPGVLNLNAATAESDKNKESSSSSETVPASVVNVGFDL